MALNKKIIVHISEVNISQESGMGRVEYYWKKSFEDAGFQFIHIGPDEIGISKLPALFAYQAYKYYKKLNITASAFIVHEPLAGYFKSDNIPCFLESHGVERRYWEDRLNGKIPSKNLNISLKSRMFFPAWRLFGCDRGLKRASKLLLINTDDKRYVMQRYKREEKDIFVFKNGVSPEALKVERPTPPAIFTVLFNGNWIERKGIQTLIESAIILSDQGLKVNYVLIGTGTTVEAVLKDWPKELHAFIKIVSRFKAADEMDLIGMSSVFVLPSYAEGQPLSLLQAMAVGKCCITTNCCGQKDTIQDQQNGFLFEVGDSIKLASILSERYHDAEGTQKIGDSARAYIKNHTWEQVSAEVVDFIGSNIPAKQI
ncbi:glycosyltransferase family 4 protein [Mucilaginibacter myungsuensis]|uniref:Glycosyltransferase family 4 protein n=1 Tax=Mucilaginibacter myungsuensis TaxID=649104 RepID=A0A929KU05_9SPHI|nr:glycosyltransferase family 4 protein [Mucilaginibacter myungsuensis]MBE9660388.1 glycosyltransferase family 4 protein [Mucilaginibacter myungsuensis]MDN3600430.1 glycosyltransferase family 4 protein [Mucilaginibacter myungsuensis]